MGCPHLLGIKNADQRPDGSRELLDGRAIERDRNDPVADAAHEAVALVLRLAVAEITQRSFNRRPIGFLSRTQLESALDARNVDRRRRLGHLIRRDFPRVTGSDIRQQAGRRERDGARAYSHFHCEIPKALKGYLRASTREFGPQSERIADKM